MRILITEKQDEMIVKKSRFIAIARICHDINSVKDLVNQTRALHPEATHVVHAAVVGSQFSFSDDREPKGTAGRPALEVLKGSGISDICVLIVRYFGGTLLGTGGLVKAYGDSVKLVLENIDAQEYIEKTTVTFSLPYTLYENTKRLLCSLDASIDREDFATEITITCTLALSDRDRLSSALSEMSNGKISL